jgi:hypothetical protein
MAYGFHEHLNESGSALFNGPTRSRGMPLAWPLALNPII